MKNRSIKYYSTNHKSPEVSFSEALLKGLAPDGGLYLPDEIPKLTSDELEELHLKNYPETAFSILEKFIGEEVSRSTLSEICNDAYNFEVPLERVSARKYILRLDMGPTASFKDFAARIMSRLMQHFLSVTNQHLTILTATSGDTGSAVANAFYGLKNINVVILFPEKEVSLIQRKQMTTLQKNIKVVSVDGKFDDCQNLVKMAFQDPELSHLPLSSANSINIGRLLPQAVYYFYAWSKLAVTQTEKAIFSVPSGNFGNLMGGIISARMGLPVKKFIVATNDNNEVPEFIRTGVYQPISPSKNCISNAMNVGHPSNLARVIALYGGVMDQYGKIIKEPDLKMLRNDLFGVSTSDMQTKSVIADTYRKYKILLEPHGAVSWHGISEYLKTEGIKKPGKQLFISLETAHPAKFSGEIMDILNFEPQLPESMSGLKEMEESLLTIENSYASIKELLLNLSINA